MKLISSTLIYYKNRYVLIGPVFVGDVSIYRRLRIGRGGLLVLTLLGLSLRDLHVLGWVEPILHSLLYASLLSLILPFQIDIRTARLTDLSTSQGLMWWLGLRSAHLAFPTISYANHLDQSEAYDIWWFVREDGHDMQMQTLETTATGFFETACLSRKPFLIPLST